MAAASAGAGTVVLVDAALAPYDHPELRWLVRQHVLAVLDEYPTLSPSVDTYTSESGASTVLLNARGLLAVPSAPPPVLLTLWLPRDYPYAPPTVYVFPATPSSSASLARDHPFVDHRTGRVRRTLPYLDDWSVPRSSLTGLVRSLAGVLRVCHVLTTTTTTRPAATPAEEERRRMHAILVDELAAALGRDTADFGRRVDQDVHAMASLQATLRARAGAVDAAVRDLEDERMGLERAVTASRAHRGQLIAWLRGAKQPPPDAVAALAVVPRAAAGGDAPRWVESKASELAVDDTMDALGHALENGELGFQEYIRHVKILARQQFFHCHAASTSTIKRTACDLSSSSPNDRLR